MALTLPVDNATISKGNINQIINVLQQPSGGHEVSKYCLSGNVYIAGGFISLYAQSLSRTSVPVSVTVDTTDTAAPAWFGAIQTGHISHGGVQFFCAFSSINGGGSAAGNLTFNY